MPLTISYYTFALWFFLFCNFWAILDRYTWNWWDGCEGGQWWDGEPHCVNGDADGKPWSVQVFHHLARLSGRITIVATTALFATMSRCSMVRSRRPSARSCISGCLSIRNRFVLAPCVPCIVGADGGSFM